MVVRRLIQAPRSGGFTNRNSADGLKMGDAQGRRDVRRLNFRNATREEERQHYNSFRLSFPLSPLNKILLHRSKQLYTDPRMPIF